MRASNESNEFPPVENRDPEASGAQLLLLIIMNLLRWRFLRRGDDGPDGPPLRVLQACAQASPAALFPGRFAEEAGLDRAALDAALDRLRLNGHLQIADWVAGQGQGYRLTDAGRDALKNPALLNRPAPEPEPTPEITSATWDRGEAVRAAFTDPGPPIITMVLLLANLLMFAAGLGMAAMNNIPVRDYLFATRSLPLAELDRSLGSLGTVDVMVRHEWWRVISYQFLHAGLLHLGANMLCLYFFGPVLESLWGSKRFLALYLGSGIIGGAAVIMTGRGAVGASGSLCGLITSFGVWLWLNRAHLGEQFTAQMLSRVGLNLVLIAIVSTMPNVSWEGHLGGAIGGILLSIPLHYQRFGNAWQRLLSWPMLLAIPLVALAAAYFVDLPKRSEMLRQYRRAVLHTEFAQPMRAGEDLLFKHYVVFVVPRSTRVCPRYARTSRLSRKPSKVAWKRWKRCACSRISSRRPDKATALPPTS